MRHPAVLHLMDEGVDWLGGLLLGFVAALLTTALTGNAQLGMLVGMLLFALTEYRLHHESASSPLWR